ncbi:unnamed protein product, partial [Musa hybrid cultivar]
ATSFFLLPSQNSCSSHALFPLAFGFLRDASWVAGACSKLRGGNDVTKVHSPVKLRHPSTLTCLHIKQTHSQAPCIILQQSLACATAMAARCRSLLLFAVLALVLGLVLTAQARPLSVLNPRGAGDDRVVDFLLGEIKIKTGGGGHNMAGFDWKAVKDSGPSPGIGH